MPKVSVEEWKELQAYKAMQTETGRMQNRYNQEKTLRLNELREKNWERTIAFKENEIKTKKIVEKHPDFIDDKKPEYILRNEIDEIKFNMDELKIQNQHIKDTMEAEGYGGSKTSSGNEQVKNPIAQ